MIVTAQHAGATITTAQHTGAMITTAHHTVIACSGRRAGTGVLKQTVPAGAAQCDTVCLAAARLQALDTEDELRMN